MVPPPAPCLVAILSVASSCMHGFAEVLRTPLLLMAAKEEAKS